MLTKWVGLDSSGQVLDPTVHLLIVVRFKNLSYLVDGELLYAQVLSVLVWIVLLAGFVGFKFLGP